jgi:predicted nucleotidyltransferase
MHLNRDLREFLELLNARGVDFLVVGAHSLAFHSRPRYTGDLDILILPSDENATALVHLLNEFGFAESRFSSSDFVEGDQIVQLGRAPNRIDLLTSLTGVTNAEAFGGKVAAEIDGIPVFFLGREQLIKNKRAVARPQDLADLAELQK